MCSELFYAQIVFSIYYKYFQRVEKMSTSNELSIKIL